jgi:hypothetical protein
MGYAYSPNLKASAERAVKRAPNVDQVINNIEELPPSVHDDELRWNAFCKIYGDPALSRYEGSGDLTHGARRLIAAGRGHGDRPHAIVSVLRHS